MKFNAPSDFRGETVSYGYRIAKTAQNMLSLCLMADERLAGNMVVSVIPGMLRTTSGSDAAWYTAQQGAKAAVDAVLSATQSGVYHAFEEEAAY